MLLEHLDSIVGTKQPHFTHNIRLRKSHDMSGPLAHFIGDRMLLLYFVLFSPRLAGVHLSQ